MEKQFAIVDLNPMFDGHKSFYGKAKVVVDYDGTRIWLLSYDTMVAFITDGIATVVDTYSATTLRHIKEFLKQNGFKAESKAQIMKDYM